MFYKPKFISVLPAGHLPAISCASGAGRRVALAQASQWALATLSQVEGEPRCAGSSLRSDGRGSLSLSVQKMLEDLKINIAEICIAIEGDAERSGWQTPQAYSLFIEPGKTDISLRLHQGIPRIPEGEKAFESLPIWTLYRNKNGTSLIRIFHTFSGLKRILVIPPHPERADLYFPEETGQFRDPFYGPTMELLMENYLAGGRGAIIHACGIAWNERGILFVGDSGAGKSTLANMWAQEGPEGVLSDDRIIVRKKGRWFWMYGTPWHGEASFVSPKGVRLERVLFLRHGQENSIKEIKGIDPVSRLITCSFLPHWDPQGMAFSMDFFTDLAAHTPCCEFTFKPDKTAIELVKEIIG
jgi:hypothetical protein